MNIVAQKKRRIAAARAIAAAALLREAAEVEPSSIARADRVAELAFLQLVAAAQAIEPSPDECALDRPASDKEMEIVN